MKRYAASLCGILALLSNTLPIVALAGDEHKETGRHEEEHRAGGGGGEQRKEQEHAQKEQQNNQRKEQQREQQNNQRKEQQRQQKEQQGEQRKEQQREQKDQQNDQRKEQQREQKEQQGEQRKEQQREQKDQQNEQRKEQEREPGMSNQGGQGGQPQNGARQPGERHGNQRLQNEGGAGGNLNPRNFGPRPATPPPLQGFNRVPLQQAGQPMPHWANNLNPQQQAQAQTAQRNMQNSLVAMPQGQQPPGVQAVQQAQASSYMNGYQTSLGSQPVVINSGNTYVNPMPQASWPGWYHPPAPGWGFGSSLLLGSIAADLGWFHSGWRPWMGPQPTGFMYGPGYMPTPYFYQPWSNQWMQPGQMGYLPGPPPEYTMPITVEAMEPMQIPVMTPMGPQRQWVNQLVMYNAYYYPAYGRWGYVNRHGFFVWVNPQESLLSPM